MSPDPHGLERFLAAQEHVYASALAELRRGRKEGHWIWFVLPQKAGLGFSSMSQRYGIQSLEEARAYLEHPVLGGWLRECVEALLGQPCDDPRAILGDIDAKKLRSCLSLFVQVSGNGLFDQALDRFFGGRKDVRGQFPGN